MKTILILLIIVLFLPNIESNIYSLQIKELLTQEVCSNGIFILDAELNIPIKDTVISENSFQLFLRNSNGEEGYASCFVLHYEGKTSAKVGCTTLKFSQAVYQIIPFTEKKIDNFLYKHTLNLAYSMKTAFKVISGTELYYYSTVYEIKLDFTKTDETKNLEFYLVSKTSSAKYSFTLDDIKIECTVNEGTKLLCPVTAKNLIQERNHTYQAYLIDSNKNKKKNYFINPIEATLQYIK